jgi:hypothetical protein
LKDCIDGPVAIEIAAKILPTNFHRKIIPSLFIHLTKPDTLPPHTLARSLARRSNISISTEAQIRANRENAQHSTGPITESGKAASGLNNFRHGLAAAFCVLPSEDQDAFDSGSSQRNRPTAVSHLSSP